MKQQVIDGVDYSSFNVMDQIGGQLIRMQREGGRK
jgi:hypothetical protein